VAMRIFGFCVAVCVALLFASCGGSSAGAKTYTIAPIFPLTAGKCAEYHGIQQGSGVSAACLVTRSECEKAASDWRRAMQSGGTSTAIEFSCT
jgi:hypothetical protein